MKKLRLVMFFVLLTLTGYSQNPVHWTLSTDVCTLTDTNKIEFSLYLKFDGTHVSPGVTTIELAAYTFGINYTPAIVINGGMVSISQVIARDPQLAALNSPILNAATSGHLRLTTSPKSVGTGFDVTTGTTYFLGRFRMTSTRAYATNTAVVFAAQCASTIGRTNYSVTYYENGGTSRTATSFSIDPPQPAMTCVIGNSCSTLITNPPCPIANAGAATYTGCGTVNVTGSATNTFDSVRWSTSGTGTFGFPTSTGINTYTPGVGELSSTLSFKAYKAGCNVSIANASYTNKKNAGVKTVASGCGSYTWAVNNTTYTSSGIYTRTTTSPFNCTSIDSLFLTINANSSSSSTVIACGSYLWSGPTGSGQTYTKGGTFTHTTTNAGGCPHTATLNLTINLSVTPLITGNTAICAGDSSLLSTGSYNGYTWSTGATTQSIYVKTAGTFMVTVTTANGCTGTASATTLINPLPTVSYTGLAVSYVVNAAAAALTGTPAGGVFSGPGITGNSFSPALAGVGGPYTIKYTYTNANNCTNSTSKLTTVTSSSSCTTAPATPGGITRTGGVANVCPNETRTYTINPVNNATSYTWTPPVGAVITSGQGTVSVLVTFGAGYVTDTLRVRASNACGTSNARILRVVRGNTPALPSTITGQTFGVCQLNGIPYSVTNVAGITYNWSFSVTTASIASGQGSNATTANFANNYVSGNIRVSATNGCGTSALRSLTVRATPNTPVSITGDPTVCVNQFGVPYSITPVAATTNYTWNCPTNARINDGTVTSTTTTLVTTATAVTVNYAAVAGNLRVRGNNACGSGSYRTLAITFVCRDNIDEGNDLSLTCYPQPASGILNVAFNVTEESSYTILLSDITGKKVQEENFKATEGQNLLNLDVSTLAPGLYILKFMNGNQQHIQKIMIE